MNCYISKLLKLWEILILKYPSIFIKDNMDDKIYTPDAFLEENASYRVGMIPLVADAVVMAVFLIVLEFS